MYVLASWPVVGICITPAPDATSFGSPWQQTSYILGEPSFTQSNRDRGSKHMAFTAIDLERRGSVATIKIKPFERTQAEGSKHKDFIDVHAAIAIALEEFRWDDSIRIIVV